MFEVVVDEKRKHKGVDIKLPQRATKSACAYAIYSPINIVIPVGCSVMIWTDVKVKLAGNQICVLNVLSSMRKNNIVLDNNRGWLDADYYNNECNEGNIWINLFNFGKKPYEIKAGDRIAQAVIVKFDTFYDNVETVCKENSKSFRLYIRRFDRYIRRNR